MSTPKPRTRGTKRGEGESPPCISATQNTQEDATQAEKADTAEASSSSDQWEFAWNWSPTQVDEADATEAS